MDTKIIEEKLKAAFPDAKFEFVNYKHDGAHFLLNITSAEFKDKSLVEQHRMIYNVLGEFFKSGKLHGLKIKTSAT